jgi:opine dehydrogenase
MTRIAVLGCGNGGQALAAHLSLQGCDVALYADPQHAKALNAIQTTQYIEVYGAIQGKAYIHLLTTDLKLALNERDVIYVVLPTFAHEATFTQMLPFLQKKQTVVTLASNFSSLAYLELQKTYDIYPECTLVDTPNLPYACRADSPGLVNIMAIKQSLAIASLPSIHTQQVINQLQNHFPTQLTAGKNVLELGLNMSNGICHPVIALLNAGRIGEDKESFYFYKDGITPAIAQLLETIEGDRLEIGRRLGLALPGFLEIMADYYGYRYNSIYEFFRQSPVHNAQQLCPKSLETRYIIEDIPYVLVPWFNLGLLSGYRSSALEAIIQLASQIMQKDYLNKGRNLSRMGLLNKTVEETNEHVNRNTLIDISYMGRKIDNTLSQTKKVA